MTVQSGDTVKVNYTGKLLDGTVFDTSDGREPLQFTVGQGQLIKDFENAVVGMNPGDTKTVQIASENAYGPHHDQLVFVIPRKELPEGIDPQVDQRFQMHAENGNDLVVTVIAASENDVTFDGNHPLAGKDLNFDISLAEIV